MRTTMLLTVPLAAISMALVSVRAVAATGEPPIVAHVCADCHGRQGNSSDPGVPSLAGQGRDYLQKQLIAFRLQQRLGVMSGIALGLDDTDIDQAATYFSQQIPRWSPTGSSAVPSDHGRTIYNDGIAENQVPACASCHALDGSGLLPSFPRLAGQHAPYLAGQLRAFRSDSRLSNPDATMRKVAATLSDHDIQAVADYIAAMH
ncbi:MAG: cytochrome c4 [Pseudomonadota bacterium]|nr:cytochrome c4 [Pseudomonadota bacterium]